MYNYIERGRYAVVFAGFTVSDLIEIIQTNDSQINLKSEIFENLNFWKSQFLKISIFENLNFCKSQFENIIF